MANTSSKSNDRATYRDLLAVLREVRSWCDSQAERVDSLRDHFDAGLSSIRVSLDNLERTTNARLHSFEGRLDVVERDLVSQQTLASFKAAIIRAGWKTAIAILGLSGLVGAIIGRYGLPFEWAWGR